MSNKWYYINGYELIYAVSSDGDIMRIAKGSKTYPGRILKKTLTDRGYHIVCLHKNKKSCVRKVHQLVAEAFLGEKPINMEINHKDGKKDNNNITNLEYVTKSENIRHAFSIGLKNVTGENHPRAKLKISDVVEIKSLIGFIPNIEIAKKFNITVSQVSRIKLGKVWQSLWVS